MRSANSNYSYYHDKDDPQFQRLVRQGASFQLERFKVSQQFPASQQLAEVHSHANMFGLRKPQQHRVCPCCSQRIKFTQFQLCGTNMDDNFLSSDIVLLFAFIRMLIYYYLLRFVITDLYNIYTSYLGNVCNDKIRCVNSFTTKMTIVNKMDQPYELFMVDILNLAFVGFSIIFFTLYQFYLYKWFVQMSITIQTQDDYTLFVSNIPVIIDVDNNHEVHYAEAIREYCQKLVRDWLNNPKDNEEVYQDYTIVAMNHGHHPSHPPRIISKINLCWDLYEINAINRQKDKLQRNYEKYKQDYDPNQNQEDKQKQDVIYDDKSTMKHLQVINKAGIELCQQFQLNQYYGFVISKFLGKAFVSFEYQHFVRVALEAIPNADTFENHRIKAEFALPPRDIHWENLGIGKWERFQKLLITFFVCSGLLFFTFLVFLGIKYKQRKYYIEHAATELSFGSKMFLRLGLSLFTIGINTVLRMAIKKLAKYQQHQTKTNQNIAVMYKSVIAIIINQIVNPFVVNLLLGNLLWRSNGITSQIINLLTISILINIIRSVVNPRTIWRWIKFKWNYRNAPPILKFQDDYNQEYAYSTFEVYQKYMFYVNQLYFISFFAYLVPFGSIMGVAFYVARYIIDRIMLLKFSSFHPRFSYDLTQKATTLAGTSILVFAIGNYLNKWLYFGKFIQPVNMVSLLLAILYTIFIWIEKIRRIFTKSHTFYEKLSYTDCINKTNFFHTYNSLNPATKLANYGRTHVEYVGVQRPRESKDRNMF